MPVYEEAGGDNRLMGRLRRLEMNRIWMVVTLAGALACGTSSPKDTSAPVDSGQATECTSGPCAVDVVDPLLVDCESDSGTITSLNAVVAANGSIDVEHFAVQVGCCPSFSASASYDTSTSVVAVEYDFADDACDCVCMLDVSYTVSGVPAGEWTLQTMNGSTTVTIE